MLASISSNYDYYLGNNSDFKLKSAIADAGGRVAEYELLRLLIEKPIQGRLIADGSMFTFYDTYSGCSLLSIFPPREQVLLCALLRDEDEKTKSNIESAGEYELISSLRRPSDILRLHSKYTGIPFSNDLMRCLDSKDNRALLFLLGLDPNKEINTEELPIHERVEILMRLTNYSSIGMEEFSSVVADNNRVSASAIFSRSAGYPEQDVQEIAGIIEAWTLST